MALVRAWCHAGLQCRESNRFSALLTSAAYWARKKLNRYATLDPEDFKKLTKAINGGYNGLADRQKLSRSDPIETAALR